MVAAGGTTMFVVDSLLMAPARGLMFILREVAKAADAEQEGERRTVMADLAALHRALDSGEVTEEEFDTQEATLLERLDRMRGLEPEDDAVSHGV
jgi:hypothetical protein